jgi:hypothetical protein
MLHIHLFLVKSHFVTLQMMEEWKLNNIFMEEDLPENVFEEITSDVNNYNGQDTTNDGQILCNVEQDCILVSCF